MDKLKHLRIAVFVATVLTGFVLFFFAYEFWVSPAINALIDSFVDLSACQDNYPEPFDKVACDIQLEKYIIIDSVISWGIKSIVLILFAFYCSKLIIKNEHVLGFEFLFVVLIGLASIVVPFTIADVTGWETSLLNMLPIYAGCILFVYQNRKLHNNTLQNIQAKSGPEVLN